MKQRVFLAKGRKLVDEVVDWLCGDVTRGEGFQGRIQSVEGARSLAHIMVIVPTAQSARNLRLALAREAARRGWGGILPPRVTMANALLLPQNLPIATAAEEIAAMADVLDTCELTRFPALFPHPPAERSIDWTLTMAETILNISKILGECAMLMSEVHPAGDIERWRDLGAIEAKFHARLREKGVLAQALARRSAVESGCRDDTIEEIVLPAAVDIPGAFIDYLANSSPRITVLIHADESEADKFDEWGRPLAMFPSALTPSQIATYPTASLEADEIAKSFCAIPSAEALPALVVCDAEMYPELEGAFQNHFSSDELVLRNPARERLASSSLGRLLGAILQLSIGGDYETFSTLIRMGDIERWARGVLKCSAPEVSRLVGTLDVLQNEHLPRTLDEVIAHAEEDDLRLLAERIKSEVCHPLQFVRQIFAGVTLDEKDPLSRELIAASGVVRQIQSDCDSVIIANRWRRALFTRLIKSATYMLEPTAENILATTGWLEVAWCGEDELVIAGFNEGAVPENVVGHPFVPDSLRLALGLTTNARRAFRDSFILAEAVRCRAPAAVAVKLHQLSGERNVMKPSRLIFTGIDDADLPSLAMRLYAVVRGNEGVPAKELPAAWRLKLPLPPPGTVFRDHLSPTALDRYYRCPFNFYLQEVFGTHSDDRNQELDALAFGKLCHAALESFAKVGPADSVDTDEIARFLSDAVWRELRSFGTHLPAVVELQGEAAVERLRAFAPHQAAWRRAGWKIVQSEQRLSCRIKGCPTLLRGTVDRVDRNERTGELAIIDYKTWNKVQEDKFKSVQLPIYRAMVEASGMFDALSAHAAKALYCIIAERKEDVGFDLEHLRHAGTQSEDEDLIVQLLTNLARGIFYPPQVRVECEGLIWDSVEKGVDEQWLADQLARKKELS